MVSGGFGVFKSFQKAPVGGYSYIKPVFFGGDEASPVLSRLVSTCRRLWQVRATLALRRREKMRGEGDFLFFGCLRSLYFCLFVCLFVFFQIERVFCFCFLSVFQGV